MTDDTPIYEQVAGERLFDPLPTELAADETCDHDTAPVDPGWFLNFDDVDSRLIRSVGAPE